MITKLTAQSGNVNAIAKKKCTGDQSPCFNAGRQEQLELLIKSFIKSDEDINRIDLGTLVFDLLGSSPDAFTDDIYEMRECLKALTSFIFSPYIYTTFLSISGNPNHEVGLILTRLLNFFYCLDNKHAHAQIHLAALHESLLDVSQLESIERVYL